jgi:RNA polymerase-binding transcription factor DksA
MTNTSDTLPPCPYPQDFLDQQRQRLLDERATVLDDIDATEEDLKSWAMSVDNDLTMSEGATAMTERELDMGLLQNARTILDHVARALAALDDGTYGWDAKMGVWIRQERLDALPWAEREVPAVRHDDEPKRPTTI